MNNPLHLWQVWRQDVRDANACVRHHNRIMDDKVARLIKCPPPDYTIAGGWVGVCVGVFGCAEALVWLNGGWSEVGVEWRQNVSCALTHPTLCCCCC